MKDVSTLTIIFIRVQALSFLLMGLFQWALLATSLLIVSLKSQSAELANFEISLASGIVFLIFGVILWARSRSLAAYFLASVADGGTE